MPMQKVSLVVLDEDIGPLTLLLHEDGVVQLAESPIASPLQRCALQDFERQAEALASRLAAMISLLEESIPRGQEGKNLLDRVASLVRQSPPPEPMDIGGIYGDNLMAWCGNKVESLSKDVERFVKALETSTDRRSEIEQHLRLVRDLLPIKVPLRSFRASELTCTLFLYLPEDRVEAFSLACREDIDPVHVSVVSGTARRLVMAMCLTADRTKLLTQVHRFEGELVELPPYDQSPREAEEAILEESARLDKEIEDARAMIHRIGADHLGELKIMDEALAMERQRASAFRLFARTESTVLLNGWVREQDIARLEGIVASCTKGRYILRTARPGPNESAGVPISLENPRPFSSFEWIVRMYGMPNYKEIDPTPLILPTFMVFFGTCLGDAGYGIVLALVSFLVLRKTWGEKVGTAFTLCGLSTIAMGWLMGGWFGNFLFNDEYGPKIPLFKAAWIDPLANPTSLLALALLLGVIHLMLGHVSAIFVAVRKGKLAQALVMRLGWCLTLSFGSIFVLWNLEITPGTSAFWRTLSTWGMTVGIIMGVVGYIWGRSGLTRIGAPAEFMYSILAHIADTISYSRILALGISSSVNAMLIDYIIIKTAWPSVRPGGGVAAVLLVILASIVLSIGFVVLHLANMALSCLSGFVHTMRLHFAEYFGKFYEAGGEEFSPFKSKRLLTRATPAEGVGA